MARRGAPLPIRVPIEKMSNKINVQSCIDSILKCFSNKVTRCLSNDEVYVLHWSLSPIGNILGFAGFVLFKKSWQGIVKKLSLPLRSAEVIPSIDDLQVMDYEEVIEMGGEADFMSRCTYTSKKLYRLIVESLANNDAEIRELETALLRLDIELSKMKSIVVVYNRRIEQKKAPVYNLSDAENADFRKKIRESFVVFGDLYFPALQLRRFVKSKIALGQDQWEATVYNDIYEEDL